MFFEMTRLKRGLISRRLFNVELHRIAQLVHFHMIFAGDLLTVTWKHLFVHDNAIHLKHQKHRIHALYYAILDVLLSQ